MLLAYLFKYVRGNPSIAFVSRVLATVSAVGVESRVCLAL